VKLTAEELNMNKETVRQNITEELGIRKMSTKTAPQILRDDQKQRWLHISSDLLHKLSVVKVVFST
jgi:hypothetical protein